MENYGFGMRRKRNLDLGGRRREASFGINWGSESAENMNEPVIRTPQPTEHPAIPSCEKAIPASTPTDNKNRPPHFGDGYQKVTVYLPVELFDELKNLKKARHFSSYSAIITDATRNELKKYSLKPTDSLTPPLHP